MSVAGIDWDEVERDIESRFASVVAEFCDSLRHAPREAVRARLSRALGVRLDLEAPDPRHAERFHAAAMRALDRVLDRFYGK